MTNEEILNHLSNLLHTEIKNDVLKLSKYVYIGISNPSLITVFDNTDKNDIINVLNQSDKLIITDIITSNNHILIYFMETTILSNISI